ncbi:hypothetical protein C8Q77DRAFT_542492 [Trametes polyzona]|nr:hypothetical protein C8Q77DRAFT_542492 [Trametes polyzona]
MFLLPFVFAGVFMLSVLNPRYTTTLISQAIPQTQLLGRAVSPIVGFLAGSPLVSSSSRYLASLWHSDPLLSSLDISETITIGRAARATTGKPGICGSIDASFRSLAYDHVCFDGQHLPRPVDTERLEQAVLFLFLCLICATCSSLVDRFRLPQALSPSASFVKDVVEKPKPRAFTPSNSMEFGENLSDVEEDRGPIPAQLNFVTPGVSHNSSFVVNTRAALEAILTHPMRVLPGNSHTTGPLDQLEEQPTDISPSLSFVEIHTEDDGGLSPGLTHGTVHAASDSQENCFHPEDVTLCDEESERGELRLSYPDDIAQLSSPDEPLALPAPIVVADDNNSRFVARTRSQSFCPLSPLLEEATTEPPSPSLPDSEESSSGGNDAIPSEIASPQSPRRSLPAIVWPRIPNRIDTRRSRTPSTQPICMVVNGNTNVQNQPRRSRTVSGI